MNMKSRISSEAIDFQRKSPRQARGRATREAILGAAAQILAKDGEARATTNRIAERAGVSIGSVYQYFADRDQILFAVLAEERAAIRARIARDLEGVNAAGLEETTRRIIGALVEAFRSKRGARKLLAKMILRRLEEGPTELDAVSALIAAAYARERGRPMIAAQSFVLTRALMGAIRAAAFENSKLLDDPAFEDELVRLAMAILDR